MAKAKTPGRRPPSATKAAAASKSVASPAGPTVTIDPPAPKKKTSVLQFFGQVRAEGRKIVWPSRKETWITTVMVLIMVAIATLFFWIVDFILAWVSGPVLSIG
jgi:preprotein translocase subunit SecE